MTLDLTVRGDPDALRASATALAGTGAAMQGAGDAVVHSRNSSHDVWQGDAGDGFRRAMSTVGPQVDGIAEDHAGMCRALQQHAGDLDSTTRRMEQARAIATRAGLPITGNVIGDPGPPPALAGAPPVPSVVPAGAPPDVVARARAADQQSVTHYNAALAAEQDWSRRFGAFTECSRVVAQARTDEASAQARLQRFIDGVHEKRVFNAADVLTGAGGAIAARTSHYRKIVDDIEKSGKIERALRLTDSPHLSRHHRAQALRIHATNVVDSNFARAKAIGTFPSRVVDSLPAKIKTALEAGLAPRSIPVDASPILRNTMRVGQKLPAVGLGVTAVGAGYDSLVLKKDPTTSVVSGIGGYAAGALAGAGIAAMGGPVGWVVAGGLVASVGVGFLIEEAMS